MSYRYKRKRKYYRKRRYRRKPWYEKKYSAMEMAGKALSGLKYVKSMLNVEKKILDTTVLTDLSDNGFVQSLTGMATGDTINTRDGNSIKGVYLGGRITLKINSSATASVARCIVFQDTQQIADTSPTLTEVLQTNDVKSFLNQAALGRFKILWDKTYTLSQNSPTATHQIHVDIPLNHHLRFNGNTANDTQKGHLYYLALSDEATNTVDQDSFWRFRFIDN